MIYITGDCHGDFTRLGESIFPEGRDMNKEDFVIICGDFGGVWQQEAGHPAEERTLDWLQARPFSVLFVDGNHENFDRLNAYPQERWHGGAVHRIRPSVLHLMRGQVYELDGKRIFTFGGASSHDIQGGILDPTSSYYNERLAELRKGDLPFRIRHLSWWEEELPSVEELEEGRRNLAACDYQVDYIITHCCASSVMHQLPNGANYEEDILTAYLDELRQKVQYKKWFFGHYHDNLNVTTKDLLLYEQIIRIA